MRGLSRSAARLSALTCLLVAALLASSACPAAEHTIYVATGPHQDLAYYCTYRQSMLTGTPDGSIEGYVKQLRDHIEMIEQHPDARYSMGNTYNTRDFVQRYPEFLPRLRRLMAEGKIDTPAQWVGWEPDWYSGELLVRGTVGPKWWAMDTLGYEPRWAQLNDVPSTTVQYPQILAKAGVDLLQVHDGDRLEFQAPSDPFLLVGLDGSSVIGYAPYGNYYGWLPYNDPAAAEGSDPHVSMATVAMDRGAHWSAVQEGLLKGPASDFGAFGDRFLLACFDHGTYAWGSQAMAEFAAQWNSDPEKREVCRVVPATEQEFARLCRERLEQGAWQPESFAGYTTPWPWAGLPWNQVMAAARARAETLLPTVEKLAAVNELLGLSTYPAAAVDEAWDRMMWTTDHNWSFSDRERRESCVQAYDLARGMLRAQLGRLASHVDWQDTGIPIVVFNALNWARTSTVETEVQLPRRWQPAVIDHAGRRVLSQVLRSDLTTSSLLGAPQAESDRLLTHLVFSANDVPAFGYKTFYVVDEKKAGPAPASDLRAGPRWMENDSLRVEFGRSGGIRRIFDKQVDRELLDPGRHPFVGVVGYRGGGAKTQLLGLRHISARLIENGPLLAAFELRGTCDGVPVIAWLSLTAGSPNLDISATIGPGAASGAKLVFTMPWNVDTTRTRIGVPYGSIPGYSDRAGNRAVDFSRHSPKTGFVSQGTWYKERQPGLWGIDVQQWLTVGDSDYSIDIAYDNLETRVFLQGPGAPLTHLSAGGLPYDRWHWVVRGHRGDWAAANAPRFGWEVNNPLLAAEPVALGTLPEEQSFATVTSPQDDVVLTTFKKAHDGKGYVARYYETLDGDVEATLRLDPSLGLSTAPASRTDLLERPLETVRSGDVRVTTRGFGIETVRWDSSGGTPVMDRFALWQRGLLRGANIRLWKSGREIAAEGFLDDLRVLRSWGANLVEIPLEGIFSPVPPYHLQPDQLAAADRLVADADRAGLFVVLTCRTGPGRADFDRSQEIWTDARAQEAYVQMWRFLAAHFRARQAVVGYDLMCEPHPDDPYLERGLSWEQAAAAMHGTRADWNALAKRITAAVRAVDADTPILISSTGFAFPGTFDFLTPTGDPRTVYVAHFYSPGKYAGQPPDSPITYPGFVPGHAEPDRYWDAAAIEEALSPVRRFQEQYAVPIFIGEFGCRRWAPGASEYFRDQIDLYEARGWSWAYWIFRETDGMDMEKSADPADKTRHVDAPIVSLLQSYFSRNTASHLGVTAESDR